MEKKLDRRFYLREFKAISHAFSTYEDVTLLTRHLAEGTARSFNAKGCSILLFDEREKQLFHLASYGLSDAYVQKGPILMNDQGDPGFFRKPMFILDMQKDPSVQYPEAAAKEGIVSMLSVPILSHGATIGIIRIYQRESREFHEEDVDAMCVLAEHLGLVIENNGLKNFFERVKGALDSLPLRMLEGIGK
jgi:signal transduction protein with GAF and PtsI domain